MTSSTHPQKNCFHCGLEVPEHLHLTVHFEDEEHETCCAGCQAVAQSIIDAGLGNYYKQRTADAEKSELPPPEMLSQLKLYDLPEVQADFVEVGAGDEREAVLMLGGITCAACVWLIEQQLLRMKGVVRVDLNYSTHRCRVVWDSAHIELSDILLKIRQTGYTAAPYDAQKIEVQAQKERKQFIVRLAVAGLGMMQTMMFALPTYFYGGDIEPLYLEILHWGGFLMVLPVVFYSALPFYRGAWRDWKNRRVGMDTPIAIAIVMTFIAGIYSLATNAGQGMYFESIAMLLFFLLGGRFMEQIARRKAGDAAERLVKLVPAFCHRLPSYPESEAIEEAAVVRLNIGDTIVVKPGEVIPVDGTVLSGESEVNEAMLTGESLPIVKRPSEKVTAGTLNTSSPLATRACPISSNCSTVRWRKNRVPPSWPKNMRPVLCLANSCLRFLFLSVGLGMQMRTLPCGLPLPCWSLPARAPCRLRLRPHWLLRPAHLPKMAFSSAANKAWKRLPKLTTSCSIKPVR